MLSVRQFRYTSDNLAYVIHGKRQAIAIDGGAKQEILSFLYGNGLELVWVTNTHEHPDHTPGNRRLLEDTGARLIRPLEAVAKRVLLLDGEEIHIQPAPGHTTDSVTFHLDGCMITGDTLFNGTVGNCFSGDLKAFYETIKRLMGLSGTTVIYAGHDYVRYSMAFAKIVEPENPHIQAFLERYDPDHVRSNLDDEKRVNPYVRFNDPDMIRILEKQGLPVATEYDRWESIMGLG